MCNGFHINAGHYPNFEVFKVSLIFFKQFSKFCIGVENLRRALKKLGWTKDMVSGKHYPQ